ncbi:MAG: hypothetical protein FGF51_05755 [Candidatus Brockarchaeota archaeon]|nr:hypothetical protein [Candidatus Brockarchaeota archaeon]
MRTPKKMLAIIFSILLLSSHFGATLNLKAYGGEADALTALGEIEEELEKGKVPSSSITEASFIVPEGFPVELAKRLWLFIAQLVSTGSSDDEIRQAIIYANNTLKLPSRISYELKDYTILLKYDEIRVIRRNDGSVTVEIPYRVVNSLGKDVDVSSVKYESNGTNLFHVLHRHPKRRVYLVRVIDPDAYTLTFIDLKTGEVFNKTARINIGLFSNVTQGCFGFESFLVAIPGHFEETREAVRSQVREFRVLLPAYDPLVVDTSISPTRVKVGDVITVSARIRNPQEAKGIRVLLGAMFSDEDAFEAWAPPPVGFPYGSGCPASYLYLRAKRPGVYQVTIYFAVVEPKSLDVVFWNGGKTVTYVVTVLPEAPKLRVELEAHALAKFANLTVTLVNTGGQEANGVKLFITGDVEEKQLDVGMVWHTWEGNVITRLLSPIAKVNVTAVYYDVEGKRHASTVLTTISTTNFVTPEEWRTYLVEVSGYEETKRIFVPGYQAATHVKLYQMRNDLASPSVSGFFNGPSLIPISPNGFTLTLENASNIAEASSRASEVRYMLLDVKPGFLLERILREDEVKKLFRINEDERLEPRKIPTGYEVKLLKEGVLNQSETVTVSDDFYEQLKHSNWEDHDYKYEDTGVKKWDLDKAIARVQQGKTIELVYRPLICQGDLVKGVLVKNYAARDMAYELEVLQGPIAEAPSGNSVLSIQAYGSISLNIVQLESMDYPIFIRLKYQGRIIASLWVHATGRVSEFWSGFWDGIKEKLPGIIITATIMIVLAVPTGGSSLLACVKKLLASEVIPALMVAGAALDAGEFLEAHSAYVKVGEVAEILDGLSQRAAYAGYINFYAFLQGLKNSIKEKQGLIVENTALDLVGDVTVIDVLVAFGKKGATEYERGRAIGRLVGAAASFASYTSIHYRFFSEGPKLLSWRGKIKEFLKGVYNWVTPPIWDIGVKAGRLAASEIAASLSLSEQNQEFKDYLNAVREDEESLSILLGNLKYSDEYISKALDVSSSLGLSERAFLSLLKAYGVSIRGLREEDLDSFLENIRKIGSRSKQCAEELLRCMQEAEGSLLKRVVELTGKISELDENGLKNIKVIFEGPALVERFLWEPEITRKILSKLQEANYYELTDGRMDVSGRIYLGRNIEAGRYRVIAEVKAGDGIEKMSWSMETVGCDYAYVPKALREKYNLKGGETIKLRIVKYIPELYFPKSFADNVFLLDFAKDSLRIGGEEVDGSRFNPDEMPRDTHKGFAITVETSLRSATGAGNQLILRFYEDESVSLIVRTAGGDIIDNVDYASLKNTLEGLVLKEGGLERTIRLEEGEILYLELESHGHRYIFPVKTLSYQDGKDYRIFVEARGEKTTALLTYLKIIFGCDAVERIREKMESGRLKLVATLEDGTKTMTRRPTLQITNEGLDIISIGFYSPKLEPKLTFKDACSYLKRIGMKDEELVNKAVERYLELIGYSTEEIESRVGDDTSYLGDYGEWLIIEHDAPRVTGIHYRVHINGESHAIDIVEEDRVIESKYWLSRKSYEEHFRIPQAFTRLVDELKACKFAMEQKGLKKVCLIFGKKVLDDDAFNNHMQRLRDALGGDTGWLVIYNGLEEYKSRG